MVRQATDTAVKASISTPVWPVTLTVARTIRPGSFQSGSIATATCVTGRGWQSGISSCVFFAAMMPAMRAAPSTSPFLALPLITRSSVFTAMSTRPSATATRSVADLAETSTMRASPPLARWVRLRARATAYSAAPRLRGSRASSARVGDLIGIIHEILAQDRQPRCSARGGQMVRLALERGRIGEHRKTGRAARFIGARERRRVEVGADKAFRWARLLDLGDQRKAAGLEPALDRRQEAARGGSGLGRCRDVGNG